MTVEVPVWLAALSLSSHLGAIPLGLWLLRRMSLVEGELRGMREGMAHAAR